MSTEQLRPTSSKQHSPIKFLKRLLLLILLVNLLGSAGLLLFIASEILNAFQDALFGIVLGVMEFFPPLQNLAREGRKIQTVHKQNRL